MALDMQKEIIRHQKGWESFAKFTFLSTAAMVAVLVLMALTLL